MEYRTSSSDDINQIIIKIQRAIRGLDEDAASAACLAIALFYQQPSISQPALQAGITAASEWLVSYVGTLDKKAS